MISLKEVLNSNKGIGAILLLKSVWWVHTNYSQFYQQHFGMGCGFYTPDWELISQMILGIAASGSAMGMMNGTLNVKQGLWAHTALVLSGILLGLMSWHMSMKFGVF